MSSGKTVKTKIKCHVVQDEMGGRNVTYLGELERQGAQAVLGTIVVGVLCVSMREHKED